MGWRSQRIVVTARPEKVAHPHPGQIVLLKLYSKDPIYIGSSSDNLEKKGTKVIYGSYVVWDDIIIPFQIHAVCPKGYADITIEYIEEDSSEPER